MTMITTNQDFPTEQDDMVIVLAAMYEKDNRLLAPVLNMMANQVSNTAYFNYQNIVRFLLTKGVLLSNPTNSPQTEQAI